MISFSDFQKLDLKVGNILSAEEVDGADKLLKLQVDLGEEKRQLVAGLANTHKPSDLEGKQIVVVANLEPKELMGVKSQGMLLAAGSEDGPVIITLESEVEPGSKIS